MRFRAAARNRASERLKLFAKRLSVLDDLRAVTLELVRLRVLEDRRHAGDGVHMRPALKRRENAAALEKERRVQQAILDMMKPARGPRNILCAVLVTTSQYGTGSG